MWLLQRHRPSLSVVVVVYNMAREAPRTLYSLSAVYQRHINPEDYEIIVVDNGSTPPLDRKLIDGLAGNFRLIRLDPAPPSPARAINRGLAEARGKVIGVMIDGARIVTPGLLHFARHGAHLYPRAVVATLGWFLGRDQQRFAMEAGYDQNREDKLLDSIPWQQDGYRLFEISAFDETSIDGWFMPIPETGSLFLSRESWDLLGGVEERFDVPGGGVLNLDTLARAVELPDSEFVILLGEATFHQFHGGTATNANYRTFPQTIAKWWAQYETIRGRPYTVRSPRNRTYLGVLPPAAAPHLARAMIEPVHASPLGPTFDRTLWQPTPLPRPADQNCAALLDIAESEFRSRHFAASAAVARMARSRCPDEPGPQRLLANAGLWLRADTELDGAERIDFHFARAKAYRVLGDTQATEAEFHAVLAANPDHTDTRFELAALRWPGENYLKWLARLHTALSPKTYLEIGVETGRSLACARPLTRAVGVDPKPVINADFETETQIFVETSAEFFAQRRLDTLPDGGLVDFAFVHGKHLFEEALKDFINVESHCSRYSVVVIHDTLPLDEPTQRRTQTTRFYTGDIWRTVLCLKHYRPDLDVFTIATPPSGLTVVTGLDPASRELEEKYEEAVARFIDAPYSEIADNWQAALNVVPNDWHVVEERLKARGIL